MERLLDEFILGRADESILDVRFPSESIFDCAMLGESIIRGGLQMDSVETEPSGDRSEDSGEVWHSDEESRRELLAEFMFVRRLPAVLASRRSPVGKNKSGKCHESHKQ